MSWPIRSSRTPIGIDLGPRRIKAAQMRRARGRRHVEALSVIPRPQGQTGIGAPDVQHLRATLSRQGFIGSDVVLAVPDDKALAGIFELPQLASSAPLSQIARIELSRMHKVRPDSLETACWALPPSARSKELRQLMAVGCAHADANELLDAFEDAALRVRALDFRTAAAVRACEKMLAPGPGGIAILDVGWNCSSLSVLCQGALTYQRTVGEGGIRSVYEAACSEFRLDNETLDRLLPEVSLDGGSEQREADGRQFGQIKRLVVRHFDGIVEDMRAPLSYVAHQYPDAKVAQLVLVGWVGIPGLAKHLASSLKIKATTVCPADLAACQPSALANSRDPGLTVAVGLAQFDGD